MSTYQDVLERHFSILCQPMGSKMNSGPNQVRRYQSGLLLVIVYPILKIILWVFQLLNFFSNKKPDSHLKSVTSVFVYQNYLVGDQFMALPAIKFLARHIHVTVICRPDCLFLFQDTEIKALAFHNPYTVSPSFRNFARACKHAMALRPFVSGMALDLDGDPRTAFLLKIAGARKTLSYKRPFAWFFDQTFSIPTNISHQADKNQKVIEGFLELTNRLNQKLVWSAEENGSPSQNFNSVLIISCWTRKDQKNWSFENWDKLLNHLISKPFRLQVIVPPDADELFLAFQKKWGERIEFSNTNLEQLYSQVEKSTAVIGVDNFLGHLAGYLNKPVFWINGSSDPNHVAPKGPATKIVQSEPMPCRPCSHRCVNPIYKQCMVDLTWENVRPQLDEWILTLT